MSFKSGEILIKGNKVTSINKDEMADSEKSLKLNIGWLMFLLKVIFLAKSTPTLLLSSVDLFRYSSFALNQEELYTLEATSSTAPFVTGTIGINALFMGMLQAKITEQTIQIESHIENKAQEQE